MKKIRVCLTILILLCFNVVYAHSNDFTDTEGHWAHNYILDMHLKGFINGYEDNTFKPDKEVTREEFAQMIYNANVKKVDVKEYDNYNDVPSTRWSYNAVQLVGNSLKETSDGYVYFNPTQPIKRQEVAKVLSDYFDIHVDSTKLNTPEELAETSIDRKVLHELKEEIKFQDVDEISPEYYEAVYNVYNSEYMRGVSDTEFSPNSSLTRAQAAVLLFRIINQTVSGEEPEEPQFAGDDFELSFLRLENNQDNLIYSPLSIKYALKMLVDGAQGNTKSQIDSLIYGLKLPKYENIENVLSLANSIYIRDKYNANVSEDYKNTLVSNYDAEIIVDKFANANNVNEWISNKTFGLIKNMVKDQIVQNPNVQMLLINALAIDMHWYNQFETTATRGKDFTKANGEKIQATTMFKELSKYSDGYYMDDNIVSVSFDLRKETDDSPEFMFTAIMPKNDSLTDYVSKITLSELKKIVKQNEMKEGQVVNVYIPKFSFEYDLKLKDDLQNLGVQDAFTSGIANFSKMINIKDDLYVFDALHRAKIDFTEEGVRAAAVTVFVMANKAMIGGPTEPINIEINKPFLFLITDKTNDEIWFVGTLYEPNLWADDMAEYRK